MLCVLFHVITKGVVGEQKQAQCSVKRFFPRYITTIRNFSRQFDFTLNSPHHCPMPTIGNSLFVHAYVDRASLLPDLDYHLEDLHRLSKNQQQNAQSKNRPTNKCFSLKNRNSETREIVCLPFSEWPAISFCIPANKPDDLLVQIVVFVSAEENRPKQKFCSGWKLVKKRTEKVHKKC